MVGCLALPHPLLPLLVQARVEAKVPLDASGSSDGLVDGVRRATKEEEAESDSDLEVSIGHVQPSLLAAPASLCTKYPYVQTYVCMYVMYLCVYVCTLWGTKLFNCPIPTVHVLCMYVCTYVCCVVQS